MSPAITHAKSYPFPIPANSYVLSAHGHTEIDKDCPLPDLTGLTPVLACGSNQSPEQLTRKFDDLDAQHMPVLKVTIKDFDAVHSPHFSAYGSIPATLHYHPGVSATLFTTWLNDSQLARMHETEVTSENYLFVRLDDITLNLEDDRPPLTSVHAYIASRGALRHNGKPLGLAAVPSNGRAWPSVSQSDVQALARDRLSPGTELETFIAENLQCAQTRKHRAAQLAEDALPFSYPVTRQF